MGNIKNKKHHRNKHRHVYKPSKQPARQNHQEQGKEKPQTSDSLSDPPEGSRIINLAKLQQYSQQLSTHSAHCNGTVVVKGETRQGLASILSWQCQECKQSFILESSDKVKGPRGYFQWECNLAAVWGEMTTGGGHSRLEETLSTLGVPVMTKSSFISIENGIGDYWKQSLFDSMAEAGRQEKRLAEERGDLHEGVPAITVIVDGGWSKRSHKHSYNAKSGVGVIIGKETGKLLFVGVRNKYCASCAQGRAKETHRCFKNWDGSSL